MAYQFWVDLDYAGVNRKFVLAISKDSYLDKIFGFNFL